MVLRAKTTYTEKMDELSDKIELFSMPIPDLGFEIKHLCKIGLTIAYLVGFNTKIAGSMTTEFGAEATYPDNASIFVDLIAPEKSYKLGFEGSGITPRLDVQDVTANLKFAAFAQSDIAFGIELRNILKSDVELNMKMPQLELGITAGYSNHCPCPPPRDWVYTDCFHRIGKGGFCSHNKGDARAGALGALNLALELWLEVFFGKDKKTRSNAYSRKLFSVAKPLFEYCRPVNLGDHVE